MTYELILGDYAYSSWSLRGWLLFEKFGLPRQHTFVDFTGDVAEQLIDFAPSRTVPTLRTPDGAIISESLAIAEELASRFPDAGIWPANPPTRATARNLATEMHSGFAALRNDCPMNLRTAYGNFHPGVGVIGDLRRLETTWDYARKICNPDGPWLCGEYCAADAFFAPVAARIATYGLEVSINAQAYVDAHLSDPAFRRWRAMGMVRGATLQRYARNYATAPWPGPAPRTARALDAATPENANCPYSGDPSTHFLECEGRQFGFCNAFCRDKTVADPDAWPAFRALLNIPV